MKIMVIADIAPTSTRDCCDGLTAALANLGHEVSRYPTWAYYTHMMKPYDEGDPAKLPPGVLASINGAVAQMILGAVTLVRPDWIIVVSGWIMPRMVLEAIKRQGVGTALYITESPYQDEEQAQQESFGVYDAVFCNERSSMPFMAAHHERVVYLPHSVNPEIHKPTPGPLPPYDVFMAGTGFTERSALIKGADWGLARVRLVGTWFGKSDLPAEVSDENVPNEALPAVYGNVPVNLNIHRTTRIWKGGTPDEQHITYAESIGPRVFEVLACGGFLITDYRAELVDAGLRDGRELVVFADAHDLGEKARHYLQHSAERQRIAAAGMAAVRGCTFSSRCESIIIPELTKGH